jgi:predicted DNA-binding transcriptional regulator YafY
MAVIEEEKIFLEERRNQIVALLKKKQRASVTELSQVFKIGEATIRRDLSDLEVLCSEPMAACSSWRT